MTWKTFLTTAVLALSPMLASAQCAHQTEQAMSCAEGSEYDADTNSCKVVTG